MGSKSAATFIFLTFSMLLFFMSPSPAFSTQVLDDEGSLSIMCPQGTRMAPRVSQLNETMLEKATKLLGTNNKTIVAVLFYANWCPFSRTFLSTFDVLSSMFPFIYHVAVEESLIRPSALSKYGVQSFPALFLQNSTSRTRYHGSRTMQDLISFYGKMTGLHPTHEHDLRLDAIDRILNSVSNVAETNKQICPYPWAKSPEKLLREDTYLFLAATFCICRVIYLFWQKGRHSMKNCILRISTGGWVVSTLQQPPTRLEVAETRNLQIGADNVNARTPAYEGPSSTGRNLPSFLPATHQITSSSSSFTPAVAESSSNISAGVHDVFKEVSTTKQRHPVVRHGVSDDVREISGKLQRKDLRQLHKTVWRP